MFDIDTGELVRAFVTVTPLRGVTWSGPGQIVYLVDGAGSDQLVHALDVSTGHRHAIASLQQGSSWISTTDGPSC